MLRIAAVGFVCANAGMAVGVAGLSRDMHGAVVREGRKGAELRQLKRLPLALVGH